MTKKNLNLYMDEDLYDDFKSLWKAKYNRHSFYSMFLDIAEKELVKFKKEQRRKEDGFYTVDG